MEKVIGIGGVFFRARDPKALARWYETHLGVDVTPDNYDDPPWFQEAGATVFEPFPATTDYFGSPRTRTTLEGNRIELWQPKGRYAGPTSIANG